ncbi:penicillin-binding transpeptidase domain-containing protein [Streptomyces sp. Tu 4128]|uniref:caspase, EACC1-associated type n=1 Tax=Streptomyces sp. Tu 4128 TaxID=1120314 RepID=UPI000F025B07|nr:penicillin-binding transpeptidase domain-containing protein [Streptomyces sp. Tu 4128]
MNRHGRHALLVATGAYLEDEALDSLWAPTRDASELAAVLADPEIGDFTVEVIENPDASSLRRAIEDFFADRAAMDTLLLHFACHGLKDEGGKLFLAATDTKRSRLESTAVPAEYVSRLMMKSRAQRAAVLLDCCYAGAIERSMIARADRSAHVEDSFTTLRQIGGERGRAVLTASSAIEYAFEGERVVAGQDAGAGMDVAPGAVQPGPSLFTGALVRGLRTGNADLNGDGEIGLGELSEYIRGLIRAVTPHQNPQLWTFGAQGDLLIARAPRRGAPPSVRTLRERLHGSDVDAALDALASLRRLAEEDSRRVSDTAREAIASAKPRFDWRNVHLGAPTVRVAGPEGFLRVMGPPVVHATVRILVEPWMRVRHLEDGFVVQVYADRAGEYEGQVVVAAATGTDTVPVRAVVTAYRPSLPAARSVEAAAEPPLPGQFLIRAVRRHRLMTAVGVALIATAVTVTMVLSRPDDPGGSDDSASDDTIPARGDIIVEGKKITGSKIVDGMYQRTYTNGELWAPVTGYHSAIGKLGGLEEAENIALTNGGGDLKGADVVTTLSTKAQQAAFDSLGNRKGAVIALDAETGSVLALVSKPTYNPQSFAGSTDSDKLRYNALADNSDEPLLNRALRRTVPPSTIFGIITVTAALQWDLYSSPDERTDSPDPYTLPSTTELVSNGIDDTCEDATLKEAITKSCVTVFAKMGVDLGEEKLRKSAEEFSFNSQAVTPIDTAVSVFPKTSNPADLAMAARGQFKTSATPVQMAMVMAAVANNGDMFRPSLMEQTIPTHLSDPISSGNAAKMQLMLQAATAAGASKMARIPGETVGGIFSRVEREATDTAPAVDAEWFVSYVIADNGRRVAVAVLVENVSETDRREDSPALTARKVMQAAIGK